MRTWNKILLGTAGAAAAAAVLLAAIAALAPRWIDLAPVKARIVARASRAVGGEFGYDNAALRLFPRPRIEARGVRILIPGSARGTVRSLSFDVALFPLLRGDFLPSNVRAENPDFLVELPPPPKEKAEKPFTLGEARERAARLLSALSGRFPGVAVAAGKGSLVLARGGRSYVTLHDIEGRVSFPPKALRADIRCTSDLWRGLRLAGRLDAPGLDGRWQVEAAGLDVGAFSGRFLPRSEYGIERGAADLSLAVTSSGMRVLQADGKCSLSSLVLHRGKQRLAVEGLRFAGNVQLEDRRTAVKVTDLRAASPPLRLAGEFRADRENPLYTVSLSSRDVDVAAVRKAALALWGDFPPLASTFDVLRGGRVTDLAVTARAGTPSQLASIGRSTVTGKLEGGTIHIEKRGLDFEGVRGDTAISRGTLTAVRVGGRIGGVSVRDGTLTLGLTGGASRVFRADLAAEADMAGFPAILSRLARNAALDRELSLVEDLDGRASGRVVLGDRLNVLKAIVDVSSMRFSGRYRRLPYPAGIEAGRFHYDRDSVEIGGLSGKMGSASFDGVDARIGLPSPRTIDRFSGRISARLEDIAPWLSTLPGMEPQKKDVEAVKGVIDMRVARLDGPLSRPKEWRFEAIGDGDTGTETVAWLSRLFRLPGLLIPRAGAEWKGARLFLDGRGGVELKGAFSFREGPAITVDMSKNRERLDFRRLAVEDADSRASVSFSLTKESLEGTFSGRLAARSLKKLLPESAGLQGGILGDFRVRIPLDRPGGSTANGNLSVEDLAFPRIAGPLRIERASLTADGRRLVLASSSLGWGETRFSLRGRADLREEGARVVMDLSSDNVVLGLLVKAASGAGTGGIPVREGKSPWPLPVTGMVRVSIESFTAAGFTWSPFRARVILKKEAAEAIFDEAVLCGISTPGTFSFGPDGMSLDMRMAGGSRSIEADLACFGRKNLLIKGTYAVSAHFSGKGTAESLPRALRGEADFQAEKGRIYKSNLLMKVLALLNITQIAFGKLPDIAHDGFAYNTITVHGTLADGKFKIDRGIMDAASLNMTARGEIDVLNDNVDVVLLASPLKTVDWIIRHIPIVRYILRGRLVALPIRVRGKTEDPTVTIHPASGIARELLGIVERTLKVPVKLIEPITR